MALSSVTVEQIKQEVLRQMPDHAEHRLHIGSKHQNSMLSIWWLLRDDPNRPNKPSKEIRVWIPSEVAEDYQVLTQSQLAKLRQFIAAKLEHFDPQHDEPPSAPVPIVEWHIPEDLFF